MADLITAAQTQIRYAGNEFKSGDTKKGQEHLDKAAAFLARAATATPAVPETLKEALTTVEWTGTFHEALDRFVDALIAKQTAAGVDVAVKDAGDGHSTSGHVYSRAENIELAESIGVLEELGGPDFFGPDLGAEVKQ